MDLRIGLPLLLLLLLAQVSVGARSNREGLVGSGVRPKRLVRTLSEFLVPPPVPAHFRGPRGPPHPPPSHTNPVQPKNRGREGQPHTRNGRFVNPEATGNEGPGYFSKLMSWLNPFSGDKEPAFTKDSHGQGAGILPKQQYPPQQPGYGNANAQYEPPPYPGNLQTSYSNLAAWMTGKACNPCNQIPWIPVLDESRGHGTSGPYPSSFGSSSYLAPPPPQQIDPADFSQGSGHQQQYPIPNPHLYPGSIPPLFKAKPFKEESVDHSSPNLDHATVFEQPPPNVNQPPQSVDHQNFNQPPQNFDHPPPNINDPPHFDHPPQNFNQPPQNFNHPPSNVNEPPPHFDHPPQNFNQQPQNFDQPPQNFNQQPLHPPQNFNQPYQSFEQPPVPQNYGQQSSSNLNHPPTNFDQPPSQNFEDHSPPIFDHQQPSNFGDRAPIYNDHPPPNFEQHHQSSQIVDVVNTSPTNLDDDEPESHHDADHAESRPVFVNSVETTSVITTTLPSPRQQANQVVHFQRSPLIDLSVVPASSSSTTAPPVGEPVTIPAAKVIDYIVSGPVAFVSSEEEKESRPTTRASVLFTTTTTTTTTQRTTTAAVDQRHQESLIETLVQSYEFFKKRNDTKANATNNVGRIYHDPDDSSASREVIPPAKSDNGKKIIQVIIPYTSQYTPSPFHPTRSVSKSEAEETIVADHNVEDVDDNVLSQESRQVSVSRPPGQKLRNDDNQTVSRTPNTIDVHRLQKNIDNWTIQEYSKSLASMTKKVNSTYPRWLASKSIPNEYLLPIADVDDSSEYYDFSNETESQRGTKKSEENTTPESTTKVNVINATYPRSRKHRVRAESSERVYVVTPIPNPNSLEDLSTEKPGRSVKSQQESTSVERAYQVLPQAVNNLAVVGSAPESAAPALWGIMEHEEIATGAEQPRWRSEADELPEPASTPILYAGHSKVSRAR